MEVLLLLRKSAMRHSSLAGYVLCRWAKVRTNNTYNTDVRISNPTLDLDVVASSMYHSGTRKCTGKCQEINIQC
jgi:hypothetical protein